MDVLQSVGAAAARLPVGAPDPVLCGESAVELYTGSLWATDDLDLYVTQPPRLIAELSLWVFAGPIVHVWDETCGIQSSRWG